MGEEKGIHGSTRQELFDIIDSHVNQNQTVWEDEVWEAVDAVQSHYRKTVDRVTELEEAAAPAFHYAVDQGYTIDFGRKEDHCIGLLLRDVKFLQQRIASLEAQRAQIWEEGADAAFYDPEIRGFINHTDNPYKEA